MQKALFVLVAALISLTHAPSASAYGVARDYRHNQVASNVTPGDGHGSGWQGFSPTWIPGLALWLRADLGVTAVAGPVTATGTTPPTVTLAGTPTAAQTSAATPYVELDCTTLGALGTSKYTVKVNGATTATNVASAASGVVLTGSGLTAGWAVGASATNDVYTANVVASAWADQSKSGNNASQATASKQPTIAGDAAYSGHPTALFTSGNSQCMTLGSVFGAQPFTAHVVGESTSGASQQQFFGQSVTNVTGPFWATTIWSMYGGNTVSSANSKRSPAIFAAVFNSTSSSLYVAAATAVASGNAGSSSPSGTEAIASTACASSFLNGKIAEMILVSGVEDPAVFWRQLTYESNRFGLLLAK